MAERSEWQTRYRLLFASEFEFQMHDFMINVIDTILTICSLVCNRMFASPEQQHSVCGGEGSRSGWRRTATVQGATPNRLPVARSLLPQLGAYGRQLLTRSFFSIADRIISPAKEL